MKSYLDTRTSIFRDDKHVDVFTDISNREYSDSISSAKWTELAKSIPNSGFGKVILAKAYNKRPARLLQWTREDSQVTLEIYHSSDNETWKFKHDHIITLEDIEAFAPIHTYSMSLLESIKKEYEAEALDETTVLARG